MDQPRIARLRTLLIKNVIGGDRERDNLLVEIYPDIGELLALADTALKIRNAYSNLNKNEDGDRQYLINMTKINEIVMKTMKDLDELELERAKFETP